MFNNYFKTAIRNVLRNKGFTFINIFGLAIGMTCCIVLFLFVQYERSFDKFHEKSEQIYRVIRQDGNKGVIDRFVMTPTPLAPALIQDFPEVQKAVRFAVSSAEITLKGLRFFDYRNFFFLLMMIYPQFHKIFTL